MAVLGHVLLYLIPTFVACSKTECVSNPGMTGTAEETGGSGKEETEGLQDNDQKTVTLQISTSTSPHWVRYLDIFLFNHDKGRRIDSYKRVVTYNGTSTITASRTGHKIIAVLANSSEEPYTWQEVHSWKDLEERLFELEKEDPAHPILVAAEEAEMASFNTMMIDLSPLLTKIRLASLTCTIQEGEYAGESLQDVKCYLTNVSHRVPAFHEKVYHSTSFLNPGGLSKEDLGKMAHPSMLYQELKQEYGHRGCILYCYPNLVEQVGIGQPFTRLVIEGKLGDTTYYYPLELSMDTEYWSGERFIPVKGLAAGKEYNFDVEIRRPGVLDPDTPISKKDLKASLKVSDWKEKEEETIPFNNVSPTDILP